MKKILIFLMVFSVSLMSFAQKSELKAAKKALEKDQFTETLSILKGAEGLISDAKTKYQSQYYLLLAKALFANGTGGDNYGEAITALKKVLSIDSGRSDVTDAKTILNSIIQSMAEKGSSYYEKGNKSFNSGDEEEAVKYFAKSAEAFENVYKASPADTAFCQNAAYVYYRAKDYKQSIKNYQNLLDLGYTGAGTSYTAKSAANGQMVAFNSKSEMDKQVKLGIVVDPEVKVTEPQTIEMMRMISKSYVGLGENNKALSVIQDARKDFPQDFNLLVDEAYAYYNTGDKAKFKSLLEEAININPNDYILHFNIGVMKAEMSDISGAMSSYNKAIELNPQYADAYRNLGAVVLDKALPIVEEMNNSLSDFDKYDRLQAKQLEIYKEALPYFEKTHELEPNNPDAIQVLVGIYEQLEMYDKSKEMKALLK